MPISAYARIRVHPHTHTCPHPSPSQAPPETEQEKALKEEADIMRHITQKTALKTYAELAKDISYTQAMNTGWKPPLKYRLMAEIEHQVRAAQGRWVGGLVGWGQDGGWWEQCD